MRPLIGQGLSAAVYTQTSDVEIEVNGLMTYDRELVKMDEARIAAAARKLYGRRRSAARSLKRARISRRRGGIRPPSQWRIGSNRTSTTADGNPARPDSAPTARRATVVRTAWNGSDIWLRRKIQLDSVPDDGEIMLHIHHDEDAEVYLNGKLVRRLRGHTQGYRPVALSDDARQHLKAGENTIAVHCHQTRGGQYIDVGLLVMRER